MKKKDQTVEEMIMKSHYLTALEIESKVDDPLSEMEREAYLEVIQDLRESVHSTNEMVKSLQDELSRSNRNQEKSNQLIIDLRSIIVDLQKQLAERDRELADLRDQNRRHNKMSFGSKSTSRKYQRPSGTISREEEKESCEGPEPPTSGKEERKQGKDTVDKTKVKSEHLDAKRGPRGPYTQMDAARKVILESSLEGVPEGWRFDHYKDIDEYNVVYKYLAEVNPQNEFILCWAHVRNKFAMTYESNKDLNADWFVRKIGELTG